MLLKNFLLALTMTNAAVAWAAGPTKAPPAPASAAAPVVAGGTPSTGDCPGADDEAALKMRVDSGPTLFLCGFEDHEIKSPTGGRAFSDFKIFWGTPKMKEHALLYTAELGNVYWVKPLGGKSLEMTELWFFSDKPEPALVRSITCTADACAVAPPRCILKLKKNPYPQALAKFTKDPKDLGDSGEDIVDQIFAQALSGDSAANRFFEAPVENMDPRVTDVFESDQRKLKLAHDLKCPARE